MGYYILNGAREGGREEAQVFCGRGFQEGKQLLRLRKQHQRHPQVLLPHPAKAPFMPASEK